MSGVNATRDVLRRELARAADELIVYRAAAIGWPWALRFAVVIGFALGLLLGWLL